MLYVYFGSGKGKTSASMGQVVRGLGAGFRIAFCQFMKRDDAAGEQRVLKDLLGANFEAGGLGFFRAESQRTLHAAAAKATLEWAAARLAEVDLLVLDESLNAVSAGLLEEDALLALVNPCCRTETGPHAVLSGRICSDRILGRADLVSEIRELKHPYRRGVQAIRGLDF